MPRIYIWNSFEHKRIRWSWNKAFAACIRQSVSLLLCPLSWWSDFTPPSDLQSKTSKVLAQGTNPQQAKQSRLHGQNQSNKGHFHQRSKSHQYVHVVHAHPAQVSLVSLVTKSRMWGQLKNQLYEFLVSIQGSLSDYTHFFQHISTCNPRMAMSNRKPILQTQYVWF